MFSNERRYYTILVTLELELVDIDQNLQHQTRTQTRGLPYQTGMSYTWNGVAPCICLKVQNNTWKNFNTDMENVKLLWYDNSGYRKIFYLLIIPFIVKRRSFAVRIGSQH